MRPIQLTVLVFATVVIVGCGDKPAPAPPAGKVEPKSGASVDALLGKETPPPATAPPTADAAPSASDTTAKAPAGVFTPRVEEAAGQLTGFVQQFYQEYKRMPRDLDELVKPAGYLPYIFPAPAGKKWVIDAKSRSVKLADK